MVEGTIMYKVAQKLKNVKRNIKIWNKFGFGHIFQDKDEKTDQLHIIQEEIQQNGYNDQNWLEERAILSDLHNIISKEEHYWKQKSRVNWLKEGDQNSRFFHLTTLKHQANNKISNIKKGQAQLTKDDEIVDEVVQFFSSLLSKDPSLSVTNQEDTLSTIHSLLQAHQNSMLKSIPTLEEIVQALNPLLGDKALGLDGFLTFFLQAYWEVVRGDITKAVQEFFGAKNILK